MNTSPQKIRKIQGLVAATFAAYQANGGLNLDLIPVMVEKMIADGLTGIFICGTNGEGPNMTIEERMQVAEAYVKAAGGRILILVHVGHPSIAEARQLAAHAQAIGADAISSVAAFYFKPTGVANLVDCMAGIAEAAPDLPFYYYHIPVLTNVAMDMLEFLQLGEQQIPNLAGIKYTASTLHEYQSCLAYKGGKFDMLYGFDELLLPALAVGARGAIGSTYSYAAPLYQAVVQAFKNNNLELARSLQEKAVEMVRCIVRYGPLPSQRAIMQMLGYAIGNCRLPLVPLSPGSYAALQADLNSCHFFEAVEEARLLLPAHTNGVSTPA